MTYQYIFLIASFGFCLFSSIYWLKRASSTNEFYFIYGLQVIGLIMLWNSSATILDQEFQVENFETISFVSVLVFSLVLGFLNKPAMDRRKDLK